MALLSDPTLGLLVEISTDLYSAETLKTMLLRTDLWKYGRDEGSKQAIVRSRLLGAKKAAAVEPMFGLGLRMLDVDPREHVETGPAAEPAILGAQLAFAREILERSGQDPEASPAPWVRKLYDALLADGYQMVWDRQVVTTSSGFGYDDEKVVITYRFLPTDTTAAPLGHEISALEAELTRRGLATALNHYQQAVDNLRQHNFEATNSQLRSTLEDVVIGLAATHANYTGRSGGEAIERLTATGSLPEREGGRMLHGLWQMSHPRGSHPGQSDADEARIRMHLTTATTRLLLKHFP